MKVAVTLTVLATLEFQDNRLDDTLDQAFEAANLIMPAGCELERCSLDEVIEP